MHVHIMSIAAFNGHQSLIHMFILYYIKFLKDVADLLNPKDKCSGESSITTVDAECEPLDVHLIQGEDETRVAAMSSSASTPTSSTPTFFRSKYTQTTAIKLNCNFLITALPNVG